MNVGVASSYQFRGINQNADDTGQVFGGVDLSAGSFYVGTWLSNVDFGGKANLEVDLYAGYKPQVGPVTLDIGVLAYTYPQQSDLLIYEGKFAGTVATESGISLTGSIFYSPEAGKNGPSYWYYEAAVSAPIPGAKVGPFSLSANASVGSQDYESGATPVDYTNWKVGLTAATENGWAVDVFYTDTDVDNDKLYEGKGVVQLKRTF
ncbi:hypothetical protein PbB2_01393 [Candidatus Phycosocius bacilliformis]|uniref:Porin domain-containing protein n=1 Tax=Candidatus Phycosocius bacilliformis TaxID=1445552 RepID=A0A2P2E9L2_9PROT|nr:TorF family putative porin [Candidatus Phycosocius bacilliformis]GBF57724.1 hypothetical protein PbB2_01393 [Candidatus Phycosocius bacilliformis]